MKGKRQHAWTNRGPNLTDVINRVPDAEAVRPQLFQQAIDDQHRFLEFVVFAVQVGNPMLGHIKHVKTGLRERVTARCREADTLQRLVRHHAGLFAGQSRPENAEFPLWT